LPYWDNIGCGEVSLASPCPHWERLLEYGVVAFLKVIILIYRGVIFNLIELIVYSKSFKFIERPAVPSLQIHFVCLALRTLIIALVVVNIEEVCERLITFEVSLRPNAARLGNWDVEACQGITIWIISDQIGGPVPRKWLSHLEEFACSSVVEGGTVKYFEGVQRATVLREAVVLVRRYRWAALTSLGRLGKA
jgi:hypothetical protein